MLAVAGAAAQVPDYFPLEPGNVWIYRGGGAPPRAGAEQIQVEVTRAAVFDGLTYYELVTTGRPSYWLRNDGAGRVYEYTGRGERLWYDFSKRAGAVYASAVPSCCGRIQVVDTGATKQIALGQFENVIYQQTYPEVFQVGITEEDFLPYVGLVFRSENTGGPAFRTMDLTYARISGVTVLNASGVGFGVALGKGYARLFVNNHTGAPLRLVFTSGQTYEVTLRDAGGKVVYRWSDGKGFPLALRAVDLGPGETSWVVALPEVAGAVTLTAELVTTGARFTSTIPL
jgi:hypothetical protein